MIATCPARRRKRRWEVAEMAEYIEREALICAIEDDCPELVYYSKRDAIDCVKAEPAADVAEVRHGRWIPEICESISKRNRLIEYKVYSCSLCGRSNGRVKKRYCSNCGARMEKEDEHD